MTEVRARTIDAPRVWTWSVSLLAVVTLGGAPFFVSFEEAMNAALLVGVLGVFSPFVLSAFLEPLRMRRLGELVHPLPDRKAATHGWLQQNFLGLYLGVVSVGRLDLPEPWATLGMITPIAGSLAITLCALLRSPGIRERGISLPHRLASLRWGEIEAWDLRGRNLTLTVSRWQPGLWLNERADDSSHSVTYRLRREADVDPLRTLLREHTQS